MQPIFAIEKNNGVGKTSLNTIFHSKSIQLPPTPTLFRWGLFFLKKILPRQKGKRHKGSIRAVLLVLSAIYKTAPSDGIYLQ